MRELLTLVVANIRRRWQEWRDAQRLDRAALTVQVGQFAAEGGLATIPIRRAWRWSRALRQCQTIGPCPAVRVTSAAPTAPWAWLLRVDAWRRRN